MNQHRYRIFIDHLQNPKGQPVEGDSLVFEVGNHDDIFHVVEAVHSQVDFEKSTSPALAVGLELFGEVMLENKDHPLCEEFRPHSFNFMMRLKSQR